jgi:hypothetical protein
MIDQRDSINVNEWTTTTKIKIKTKNVQAALSSPRGRSLNTSRAT